MNSHSWKPAASCVIAENDRRIKSEGARAIPEAAGGVSRSMARFGDRAREMKPS
jgi:hypothetical protein